MGKERKFLRYETLPELDNGLLKKLLDDGLHRAAIDVVDRPMDVRPRVVTLTISVKPDAKACTSGDATIGFDVSLKLPKQQTRDYATRVTRSGELLFNPDAPESVDQETIDFDGSKPAKD